MPTMEFLNSTPESGRGPATKYSGRWWGLQLFYIFSIGERSMSICLQEPRHSHLEKHDFYWRKQNLHLFLMVLLFYQINYYYISDAFVFSSLSAFQTKETDLSKNQIQTTKNQATIFYQKNQRKHLNLATTITIHNQRKPKKYKKKIHHGERRETEWVWGIFWFGFLGIDFYFYFLVYWLKLKGRKSLKSYYRRFRREREAWNGVG